MAIFEEQSFRDTVKQLKRQPTALLNAVLDICRSIIGQEMPLSGATEYPVQMRAVVNRAVFYQQIACDFAALRDAVTKLYPENDDKAALTGMLTAVTKRYIALRKSCDEKRILPFRVFDSDTAAEPCGEGSAWLASGASVPEAPDRERKLELLRYDTGIARKETERDIEKLARTEEIAPFKPDTPPSIWRCNQYKWVYWIIALGISAAHFVVADLCRGRHARESTILLIVLFVRIVVMIFRPLDIKVYKVAQFLGIPTAFMALTIPWYVEHRVLIIIALFVFVPLLGFCPLERWVFVKLTRKNDPKLKSLQSDYEAETAKKRKEYEESLPAPVDLSQYDEAIRVLREQKAALVK